MGAALYIDVIVIFVWKFSIRLIGLLTSAGWERRAATVLDVESSPASVPGCPVVKISYLYAMQQESYEGTAEVPFLFIGAAKQYAKAIPARSGIVVRINPKAPEDSLFFSGDRYHEAARHLPDVP